VSLKIGSIDMKNDDSTKKNQILQVSGRQSCSGAARRDFAVRQYFFSMVSDRALKLFYRSAGREKTH